MRNLASIEQIRDGEGLRKALLSLGANEQMLGSKTYTILEDAVTNNVISDSETARQAIEAIEKRVRNTSEDIRKLSNENARMKYDYESIEKKLEQAEISVEQHVIRDPTVIDGIVAYRKTLESTRDVFGDENMSEAVICKAIEAASYGMWRSIMGPKFDERKSRTVL